MRVQSICALSMLLVGLYPLATACTASADGAEPRVDAPGRWRANGLAHLDLPLRFRARLDASYSRRGARFRSERLAEPYLPPAGPAPRRDRALTSRVSLTRPIIEGVELEISWAVRNGLRAISPAPFESHAITAGFRVAPSLGRPTSSPRGRSRTGGLEP